MNRTLIGALMLAMSSEFALAVDPEPSAAPPTSGVDLKYIDRAVRPQDDFFRYLSGIWLDTVEIPVDRARYGAFDVLRDLAEQQLRAIIDDLARSEISPPDLTRAGLPTSTTVS